MNERTVLIVGGGGFIGGHLAAELKNQPGVQLRVVDIKPLEDWFQVHAEAENTCADLKDLDSCRAVCEGAADVYNLACDTGGIGFREKNKSLCMISVVINTNLLVAARDAEVERYFFASSACGSADDEQRSEDVEPLSEDGYGWEKLFSERMCHHFREDFGTYTRVARLHNVYGPSGAWEGELARAPAAICRKVIAAKLNGDHEIEIWGDGNQTRSFVYVDDCVYGIQRIMIEPVLEPIDLGSSDAVTINGLVDIAESIAGVTLERCYDSDAPTGVSGRISDNTKIQEYLGWEPSIRLRDGMERTYRWIYDKYVTKYEATKVPN